MGAQGHGQVTAARGKGWHSLQAGRVQGCPDRLMETPGELARQGYGQSLVSQGPAGPGYLGLCGGASRAPLS